MVRFLSSSAAAASLTTLTTCCKESPLLENHILLLFSVLAHGVPSLVVEPNNGTYYTLRISHYGQLAVNVAFVGRIRKGAKPQPDPP